jgi:hypothetical protein
VLVVFPFFVLVRIALSAHASYGFPTWLALILAGAAAVGILTAYAGWVAHRLTGQARFTSLAKTVAVPLVVGYTLYALIFVSAANAKSEAVRDEYRRLHPILRIAVSTVMLADHDLLITDMTRTTEDYARMGLPAFRESRHLRQQDGYAHALDLRTLGRGPAKNLATRGYFALMGFRTLRHGGTEDHLHVELPTR